MKIPVATLYIPVLYIAFNLDLMKTKQHFYTVMP